MFKIRKLTDLQKLKSNPRTIKDSDFIKLCKSIEENDEYFNARPIILSDRTGELIIIAGNQRFEAATKIGLKEVPTYLISNLTEEKEREIIIRDNVNSGEFDWDMLANEWDAEELEDWGLEMPIDLGEAETEQTDLSDSIETGFKIEINCSSEFEQEELYNEFIKRGIECRLLTL